MSIAEPAWKPQIGHLHRLSNGKHDAVFFGEDYWSGEVDVKVPNSVQVAFRSTDGLYGSVDFILEDDFQITPKRGDCFRVEDGLLRIRRVDDKVIRSGSRRVYRLDIDVEREFGYDD